MDIKGMKRKDTKFGILFPTGKSKFVISRNQGNYYSFFCPGYNLFNHKCQKTGI